MTNGVHIRWWEKVRFRIRILSYVSVEHGIVRGGIPSTSLPRGGVPGFSSIFSSKKDCFPWVIRTLFLYINTWRDYLREYCPRTTIVQSCIGLSCLLSPGCGKGRWWTGFTKINKKKNCFSFIILDTWSLRCFVQDCPLIFLINTFSSGDGTWRSCR